MSDRYYIVIKKIKIHPDPSEADTEEVVLEARTCGKEAIYGVIRFLKSIIKR